MHPEEWVGKKLLLEVQQSGLDCKDVDLCCETSAISGVTTGGVGAEKQSVAVVRIITESAVACRRNMNSSFQGLDRESSECQLTEHDRLMNVNKKTVSRRDAKRTQDANRTSLRLCVFLCAFA